RGPRPVARSRTTRRSRATPARGDPGGTTAWPRASPPRLAPATPNVAVPAPREKVPSERTKRPTPIRPTFDLVLDVTLTRTYENVDLDGDVRRLTLPLTLYLDCGGSWAGTIKPEMTASSRCERQELRSTSNDAVGLDVRGPHRRQTVNGHHRL